MSIALFAAPGILAPLQGLWRWFMPATAPSRSTHARSNVCTSEVVRHSIKHHDGCAPVATQSQASKPAHRPLRILRILEADQAPANVGRMVISGRMADVCAELDRLAACETPLH